MRIQIASSQLGLLRISCRSLCVSLLLSLSLLFVLPSFLSVHAQDGVIVHTVVYGDTLSSIARRYNVTVVDLMVYNNIRNANLIRPNQRILVPTRRVQPPPTRTPMPTVQPSRVSATQSPATPTRTQPVSPSPADTDIVSPPPGFTAVGEPFYTVRRGDTLGSIARMYGVSVAQVMERNHLKSTVITVGQRLIIPLPGSPASTSATPTPTSIPTPIMVEPGEEENSILPSDPVEEAPTPTSTPETSSMPSVLATPESVAQ